jgi:hypothetical protein
MAVRRAELTAEKQKKILEHAASLGVKPPGPGKQEPEPAGPGGANQQ